ncbi:hypothetical protein DB35_17070 [Streptomyces abyssalis]|uniref:Uncharacterized protein n=1 Tax=Streptomyces abyssalis TaxID=933944 RepID=A0A1E7JKF7_9ACTN|nr:hypothetical protein [Streptomyces abyssalis]OEU88123.1 hypothetical protein AN215_18245 [Streptomyces abyssalis]OEU90994.1 hypothetical protein DB35_17070 [Streptomyces abyssalis]
MGYRYDRETADRLARAVLAGSELKEQAGVNARAELEQFDVVAHAFHATPRRGRRRETRQSEPLAFGVEGIATAVTTLVLAVAVDVLSQLARARTERTASRVASWFRRVLLRRPGPSTRPAPAPELPEGPAALTPEQMQQIHGIARRNARQLRVPEEIAKAVADGIVAELAMAPAAPDAEPGAPAPGEPEAHGRHGD